MASSHSRAAVVKAFSGNAVVTVVKTAAWLLSGSGAMLSETIHSLVDTLNQGLLLIGQSRAVREPTERHPYGFGIEANFWGLLAAIGILVFGGGLSIQHGLHALEHPTMPTQIPWVLAVLGVSFVIEFWILVTVVRAMAHDRGDRTWRDHLSRQPPGTMTVLLEDLAAVSGILVAAGVIWLCQLTGNGVYDAVGQLLIGGMLVLVGVVLVWRSRGMLIGQAIPGDELRKIRIFLEDQDGVARVTNLKTRQLGSHQFRLKAEVVFRGGHLAERFIAEVAGTLAEASEDGERNAVLGRYADRLFEEQAKYVDRLEDEIREAFPGATYIDIEPHLRDF